MHSELLLLQNRDPSDASGPFGGAGGVDTGALRVYRDGHGHVVHVEFINGFHAKGFEGQDAAALDGFADEIGCASDGHQVDGFVVPDRFDGGGAALGLADHAEEGGLLEHLAGDLVHARGGGGAGGADGFVADGVDGADVVDETSVKVDGELFALGQHVSHALVGGIASGQQLAGEQHDLAGLPGLYVVAGDGVEVYATGRADVVGELGPCIERGWVEHDRTRAIQMEVSVTSR